MLTLISHLVSYLKNRHESEEGQTLVEYGLLLALIAIVVIAVLVILGPTVAAVFQDVNDAMPAEGG